MLPHGNTAGSTSETVHAATADVTYGDVNSDGVISILDMILLKSYFTENNTKGFSVEAADLDGDGKTDSGSVKSEVLLIIDSLPISNEQKDALYRMNGWSERTINEAPWR